MAELDSPSVDDSPFNAIVITSALVVLLTGCATVVEVPNPRETRNLARAWQAGQPVEGQKLVSLFDVVEDPRIRAIAQRALESNLNLRQTALRLQESRELLGLSRAAQLPSLDATASANRSDDTIDVRTTVSAGFRLSWEVDVWGRLADRRSADLADYDALAYDYEAARNSLTSRAIQFALEYVFRRQVIDIEVRRVESLTSNVEVIRSRFQRGLGTLSDWDAAQASLASAEATLVQRREDLARTSRSLSAIMGDLQLTEQDLPAEFPEALRPLVPIPAEVLVRRPDVAAAIARIRASEHAAAAAGKAMLPSFSITGSVDQSGRTLSKAIKADPMWSIIGGITAPLFDGGQRTAEADAARTSVDRSLVAYQEVLLTAVVEVENALGTEAALNGQLGELVRAHDFAQRSRQTSEDRYSRGLADVVDLLLFQRQAFGTELRLLETRFQALTNRINLSLALGLGVAR